MLFLTVPTRGSRPELLSALITSAELPSSQIVLVRTSPNADVSSDVVVDDFGPINIQRWWNAGIDEAVRRGATAVAVANDDVSIAPGVLQYLAQQLIDSGAVVATPGASRRLWRGGWPFKRRIDGSLWVLDVTTPIRPDERFRWAFGDDDLDVRCRIHGSGVLTVPVRSRNVHHNEESARSQHLQELTLDDRRQFWSVHPWIAASRLPLDTGRKAARILRRGRSRNGTAAT